MKREQEPPVKFMPHQRLWDILYDYEQHMLFYRSADICMTSTLDARDSPQMQSMASVFFTVKVTAALQFDWSKQSSAATPPGICEALEKKKNRLFKKKKCVPLWHHLKIINENLFLEKTQISLMPGISKYFPSHSAPGLSLSMTIRLIPWVALKSDNSPPKNKILLIFSLPLCQLETGDIFYWT